jgi:hypothetical protein
MDDNKSSDNRRPDTHLNIHQQNTTISAANIHQQNTTLQNYNTNGNRSYLPGVFQQSIFQHDFTPNNSAEIVREIIEVEAGKEQCICLILVLVIIGVILGAVYGTQ